MSEETDSKSAFDNREFWNDRYRKCPGLGSGPGSRGYAAWVKQNLVKRAIADHGSKSIIDIGCGDLCWLDEDILSRVSYRGLDISMEIVERNRKKYPNCVFRVHDLAGSPVGEAADLVVCFDVLIHQCEERAFRNTLSNILKSTARTLLVSYTTANPTYYVDVNMPEEIRVEEEDFRRSCQAFDIVAKAATAVWGDLRETVKVLDPDIDISVVGRYRMQTVYLCRRR